MTDCSKKFTEASLVRASRRYRSQGFSEVAQVSITQSPTDELEDHECLAVAGKELHAQVDNAILKVARVLARQAAREDHARQLAGSASHDETRGNLREIFHRPPK